MQVLHERFEPDPQVNVLAIHFDERGDPQGFLAEHGATYPTVLDGREIAKRFGIDKVPTFIVLGPDGRVVYKHVGQLTDEVRDEIERVAMETRRGESGTHVLVGTRVSGR